jgi:two-component system copper resistance phosphate regulon response regulator CusR
VKSLVIEDEPKAAEYLRQGLSESGYAAEVAHDGMDGLHAATSGDHDLLILDVMLPGIDGFAVLSALRTTRQTPVLMLTARGKTDDKVRGFDLGADDYLVKPFQFPELIARVKALLKRGQPAAIDPVLRVEDLEIDSPSRHALGPAHRSDGQGVRPALAAGAKNRGSTLAHADRLAGVGYPLRFRQQRGRSGDTTAAGQDR